MSATEAGPLVLEKNVPYLDVRTEEEFKKQHVQGSINVPWFLDLQTRQVRLSLLSGGLRSMCKAKILEVAI